MTCSKLHHVKLFWLNCGRLISDTLFRVRAIWATLT